VDECEPLRVTCGAAPSPAPVPSSAATFAAAFALAIVAGAASAQGLPESTLKVKSGGLHLNSVSGLVSKIWYRIPFDQSELSISRIPPTGSPTVGPGRDLG